MSYKEYKDVTIHFQGKILEFATLRWACQVERAPIYTLGRMPRPESCQSIVGTIMTDEDLQVLSESETLILYGKKEVPDYLFKDKDEYVEFKVEFIEVGIIAPSELVDGLNTYTFIAVWQHPKEVELDNE